MRSSITSGGGKGKPPRSRRIEPRRPLERELAFLEERLWRGGFTHVAGVDEAGRGPLAGPVVAAAVILAPGRIPPGIDDSKKLTPGERSRAFDLISEWAVAVGAGVASPETIDRVNILEASLLAMKQAVASLKVPPECIIVDGRQLPELDVPALAVVGGDARCVSVAAASIVAKVLRDRMMEELDLLYPSYRFARNKGYCTAEHLEALRAYGPTRVHRFSFEPVERSLGVSDE